jgi:hypothetical protein
MHAPVADPVEKGAGRALRPGLDLGQERVHGSQPGPMDRSRERLAGALHDLAQNALDRRKAFGSESLPQPRMHRFIATQQHDGEPAAVGVRLRKERHEPRDRRFDRRRVGEGEPAPPLVADGAAQVVQPLAPGRDRAEDAHAEPLLEPAAVDANTDLRRLVVHVEIEGEGEPELGQLRGEHERAPQVLGVGHLHDGARGTREQDIAGHGLVLGHGHEAVDSGRVEHFVRGAVDLGLAARHGDGGPGVVGNGDVAAGEEAEEHALADVRVAHEDDAGKRGGRHGAETEARLGGERRIGRRDGDPAVAVGIAVAHVVVAGRRGGSIPCPSTFSRHPAHNPKICMTWLVAVKPCSRHT